MKEHIFDQNDYGNPALYYQLGPGPLVPQEAYCHYVIQAPLPIPAPPQAPQPGVNQTLAQILAPPIPAPVPGPGLPALFGQTVLRMFGWIHRPRRNSARYYLEFADFGTLDDLIVKSRVRK